MQKKSIITITAVRPKERYGVLKLDSKTNVVENLDERKQKSNILIKQVQKTSMEINIFSSIITYIFLVFGLYYFIIKDERSVLDAVILGMVIYGVFAGTNFSLLKNWSLKVALIDTVWGGVLFGLTTLSLQYIKGVYIRK